MILKALGPDDLTAAARIHAAAFDSPWSAQVLADLLTSEGGFGLVAEEATPCGFILCRALAGEAEILTLAVHPDQRRRGLGRDLVIAAIARALDEAIEALFLEVAVDNPAAMGLYLSCGFRQVGRRKGYYRRADGQAIDALVMRRDLGQDSNSA